MASDFLNAQTTKMLGLLRLRTKRSMLGLRAGKHLSPKRGQGMDFAEYRAYLPGDDPRHIDWGVYGRTEKMYVRVYQEEQNLSVFLFLDTSASMHTSLVTEKWEHSKNLLLSLSYIALGEQETVTVVAPGGRFPSSFQGVASARKISSCLEKIDTTEAVPTRRAILQGLANVKVPGVGIIISDFLMPLEEIDELFRHVIAKNLETTAIQIIGDQDLSPFGNVRSGLARDSETGEELELSYDLEEYKELFHAHQVKLHSLCERRSIRLIQTSPTEDIITFLSTSLVDSGLVA